MTAKTTEATGWHHCYDSSWKGMITPESFAHPAKFSRDLIERILDHCLEQGYLQRGDVVGDPFGGIGTGGIAAAYRGLRWVGVELEPRFVGFAESNFELHRSKWAVLGVPTPQIIQGDSRRFHKAVQASAVVTSPPYADSFRGQESGIDESKLKKACGPNGQSMNDTFYGQTPGQIGQLKAGNVDAVVASPPFAGTSGQGGGGINVNGYVPAPGRKWTGDKPDPVGGRTYQGQGGDRTLGNIETLKEGSVDGVVSSPPYEDSLNSKTHGIKDSRRERNHDDIQTAVYGDADGQIGREKGETYWQAVDAVYRSCWLAIKPGGVLVLVVKDYVKNGNRVPLCDDTARLLTHIGFEVVERVHAMLVKSTQHNDLFDGETTTTKSRKSFFRRLAEKKGSPEINYEEVIFARVPHDPGRKARK